MKVKLMKDLWFSKMPNFLTNKFILLYYSAKTGMRDIPSGSYTSVDNNECSNTFKNLFKIYKEITEKV